MPDEFFARILRRFIDSSESLQQGTIGEAISFLFNAQELVDFALPIMVQAAHALDDFMTLDISSS